jgi:hypothetical protein
VARPFRLTSRLVLTSRVAGQTRTGCLTLTRERMCGLVPRAHVAASAGSTLLSVRCGLRWVRRPMHPPRVVNDWGQTAPALANAITVSTVADQVSPLLLAFVAGGLYCSGSCARSTMTS